MITTCPDILYIVVGFLLLTVHNLVNYVHSSSKVLGILIAFQSFIDSKFGG